MRLGRRMSLLHFAGSPAWPQVSEGEEKTGEIHLLLCRPLPLPQLECQRAGWLGAGALEAPESGSKGSFFGTQKLGPTRAKEERRGRGGSRPARERTARMLLGLRWPGRTGTALPLR